MPDKDKPAVSCVVHVINVSDERDDRSNLGLTGNGKISIDDAGKWLADGLRILQDRPYRLDYPTKLSPSGPELRQVQASLALKKLYIWRQVTSKSANVVATLQLGEASAAAGNPLVLRGRETGVNWVGSEAELVGAFELALEQLMNQLDRHFLEACAIKMPS